jgi:hypothetical protein
LEADQYTRSNPRDKAAGMPAEGAAKPEQHAAKPTYNAIRNPQERERQGESGDEALPGSKTR